MQRFGQASAQRPQRMHADRNSSSGSAPGGRIQAAASSRAPNAAIRATPETPVTVAAAAPARARNRRLLSVAGT
jgi:hypothetical protein